MESTYISRIIIKNYRNFKYIDTTLENKQVIVGENNVGKTNFLRAIQLILDPSFSDEDRMLEESDFWDGLENPMENKNEIIIKLYIKGYKNNPTILTMLEDGTVLDENSEEYILLTYKFYSLESDEGSSEYIYNIFLGNNESKRFGHEHRKYLNIKVIKALRDVEAEIKNSKISPITKLLKEYKIKKEKLEEISSKYQSTGSDVLLLDEIVDLTKNINKRFSDIIGSKQFDVTLKALEIDPNKILSSLKLLLDKRNVSDISLGINNILYISLILQLLQEKIIPTFLTKEEFDEFAEKENSDILNEVYVINVNNNYFLKDDLNIEKIHEIYSFMLLNNVTNRSVTILAIEEPEAHLHPIFQRLIYKDVIRKSDNSVLLTTHSTHITAISPINTLVNLQFENANGTIVNTTGKLDFDEKDLKDLERYINVKRGEIYFGKGVILVEGIAEEYLISCFAELLNKPLDEKGIIICNIDSTNFYPYVKLLKSLNIPYTVITDGDPYYIDSDGEKVYYSSCDNDKSVSGYLGLERIRELVIELKVAKKEDIPTKMEDERQYYNELGFFIGDSTLEVQIMEKSTEETDKKNLCKIFNELTNGGERQKENFAKELSECNYWKCLRKIESNGIGKGRFAQRLSSTINGNNIPDYIELSLNYICAKVE